MSTHALMDSIIQFFNFMLFNTNKYFIRVIIMPRKRRIHYRSAFYHVMLRGNNRKKVFFDKDDYQQFLSLVREAADAYCFVIHLYCLMTNHIHFVIEVGDVPLSRIMQSIVSRYAKIHNKKYKKIGHLFQGRYKSKLISDDHYLLELCYYIHMNPIKAKMCQSLNEYVWSSHHGHMAQIDERWFNTSYLRLVISNHFGGGVTYSDFVESYRSANSKPLFCKFDNEGVLSILNVLDSRVKNKPSLSIENISLAVISKIVCEQLEVTLDAVASESQARNISLARSMIAYFAHYHAKYSFIDIATVICREPPSISKTLRRHLRRAEIGSDVKNAMNAIEKKLSVSDLSRC